jgi:hypothetical protein
MLKWKKKCLDESGDHWFEADVKSVGWTYVVDRCRATPTYECSMFISKTCSDDVKFTNKEFKTIEAAQKCCERHLTITAKKLNEEIKK